MTTIQFPTPLPVTQTGATSWDLIVDGVTQKVTNLTKLYWEPEGYTKGDLLAYYYNVAPWILPFLADRALTLKRMPDGADADFFYAKNAPGHVPEWVPRAPIRAEGSGDVIDYLMAQRTASLVYVANLGCIEMHPWHSRVDALGYPDYAFFDLDPFGVSYRVVKDVALVVKAALDSLGLVGYPRTSGATGMHIYVPIDRVHTFAEVREFITRVCRLINRADPERTTMAWQVSDRDGRVFLDAGMNTEGRNIASAYSVRPHRGATVSTPLRWEELESDVEPGDFTMASIWPRLTEVGDIFTEVLAGGQDLWTAMDAVGLEREKDRRGPSHTLLAPTRPGGVSQTQPVHAGPDTDDRPGGGVSRSGADGTEPDTPRVGVAAPTEAGELETYQAMRDFALTAEPAGDVPDPTGDQNRFVIQHHLATRLHHDLRLERGGTLRSWALPKGLPLVPKLTHLAMQTEDHPLEYLTFDGEIPQGEYGGGQMRIWDTGTYSVVEWEEGKATVRLDGIRHQGEWHLFQLNRRGAGGQKVGNPREWLIVRSATDTQPLPPEPPTIKPCLAGSGGEPFDDPAWIFEIKWDGVRVIATTTRPGQGPKEANSGRTVLRSRNGNDVTPAYPELWPLWERVLAFNAVLDGEIVALDEQGRPSFSRLQHRMHLRERDRVDLARSKNPVQLVVFDLLALDGQVLTGLPLTDRLALLDDVFVPGPAMIRSDPVEGAGIALFQAARTQGLEGIVAKRATSTYQPGRRTNDWRKIKVRRTADVVVGGWLESTTGNGDLGSLLVGAYEGAGLAYLGRVGTGFDAAERARLLRELEPTDTSPFATTAAKPNEPVHWVHPRMVVEVEYGEVTPDGNLRAPAYVHERSDLDPAGVVTDVIT
ncbi:non-homologous end-joining DNA ligase [Euzebya tangerina]|uniref:non-homologous end-joining DNA ligase n=1 Tax=Euzebya tangerina TaxID=591198 RepID=UPI0013C2F0E8|nr:non-homologous end-joining DNA ligase [Euzebya tangerina]